MKPGSSDRCKSKKDAFWRCHLRKGHDGKHQAPAGRAVVYWTDKAAVES